MDEIFLLAGKQNKVEFYIRTSILQGNVQEMFSEVTKLPKKYFLI